MQTGSESVPQGQAETVLVWLFRLLVLRVAAQAGALPAGDSLRLAGLRARQPDDTWLAELNAIGRAWVSARQWAPLAQPGALFDPSLAPAELPEPAGAAQRVQPLDAGIAPAELHSPRAFGALYERLLAGRRSRGAFYTPAAIVEQILADALTPFVDQIVERQGTPASRQQALLALRVCDPAAGTGAFLVAAAECLVAAICRAHGGTADVHAIRRQVLENCVYGVELDALGAAIAQVCLCLPLIQAGRALPVLNRRVVAGNALTGRIGSVSGQAHPLAHWQAAFPDAPHGFDLVLGNPPYIDSERMTTEQPQLRRFCAATWETARGNWDMFVVFVEIGLRLTRPGGRCAMIVPNRLLDAPYAAQARRMLGNVELEALLNYSNLAPFQAGVYPVVFVARNAPAPPGALLAVRAAGTPQRVVHVAHTALDQLAAGWSALFSEDAAFVQYCLAHGAPLAGMANVDE
ncbi:MAG TPA: N-6 DNA methylase, partial [Roseiflexaceae bacterium]|nr:N-6 DNA methylase [Roseiflexaceae bacterium]